MASEHSPPDRITAEKATDVGDPSALSEEARQLLSPEISPADYLEALTGAGLLPDAIRFLAHALPKVDAVRWACAAAQTATGEASDSELRCIESALRWVEEESEENRQEAMAAAEEDDFSGAAAWAAAAASWSGGSMAPPEFEEVPPPEHLTGTAAASAVLLASVATEPGKVQELQRELLQTGLDLASDRSVSTPGP